MPEDTPITIQVLANDAAGPTGSLSPGYVDLALLQLQSRSFQHKLTLLPFHKEG